MDCYKPADSNNKNGFSQVLEARRPKPRSSSETLREGPPPASLPAPWQQPLACGDITLTSAPISPSRSSPGVSQTDTRLWFKAHPNPAQTHHNLFTSAKTLLHIRSQSQVPGITTR